MTGCPECGLPLCNQCIDIKIYSASKGDDATTATEKGLIWHEAECALLKNNSVRISLEGKDEKEASKVKILSGSSMGLKTEILGIV